MIISTHKQAAAGNKYSVKIGFFKDRVKAGSTCTAGKNPGKYWKA
jgi:hypothetical protein